MLEPPRVPPGHRPGRGGAGGVPVSFTDLMALQADELRKRQMACILLWMAGGPSQLETFDPKPGTEHGGDTKAIDTAVPGIKIAEGWEQTAKVMKEVALIRSMTNKEGNHQRATYQLHTGYAPTGTVKHPSFGCSWPPSWATRKFDLPHIVSIGGADDRRGLPRRGARAVRGSRPEQAARQHPAEGRRLTASSAGWACSTTWSGRLRQTGGADRVKDHRALYRQTAGMVLSPRMKAFDLDEESPTTREAYGQNPFGQGCLLARRLVAGGGDVRRGPLQRLGHPPAEQREGRRTLAQQVDPGFASLVADLKSAGCSTARWSSGWANSAGPPRSTPTPAATTSPGSSTSPWPAAASREARSSAPRAPTDRGQGPPRHRQRPAGLALPRPENRPHQGKRDPVGRPIKIVDGGKVVPPLFG